MGIEIFDRSMDFFRRKRQQASVRPDDEATTKQHEKVTEAVESEPPGKNNENYEDKVQHSLVPALNPQPAHGAGEEPRDSTNHFDDVALETTQHSKTSRVTSHSLVPTLKSQPAHGAGEELMDSSNHFDDVALDTTQHSKTSKVTSSKCRNVDGASSQAYFDASVNGSKISKPFARVAHVQEEELRRRGSTQFGDVIPDELVDEEDVQGATWKEVYRACCCHSVRDWGRIFLSVSILCFFLYFFLLGLELLGVSFRVVGGCTAGSLFGDDTNPVASLMIGIIATTLLQSSSTTTAIVVSLVGGGLDVQTAIYMVMGANIGTSVTSIIVTLGHLGDGDELERAFAGAVVNFIFKLLTVLVLFPLEVAAHYLYYLTKAMLPSSVDDKDKWEGPIKKMVSPLGKKIIIANKKVIEQVANGTVDSCEEYYPVYCVGGVETYETCNRTGLIGCDSDTNGCPAFFQNGASKKDDTVSGAVCLILALFLLIACLIGLVALLHKLLAGASERIIYKATNINDYVAMAIGCGVTILVQSSSITTSTLVPLAGMGVLKLEQMYPLTLGADIGTTFTALMAAMVSNKIESLQVALAHLFFNLTGIVLWYPVPFLRRIPLNLARKLGKATRIWRGLPIVFIVVFYFVVPLILFGISALFEAGSAGFTVLGIFFVVSIGVSLLYFAVWWKFKKGKAKCIACMASKQRKNTAVKNLPDDMDYLKCDMEYLKNEMSRLKDFAGLLEQGKLNGSYQTRPLPRRPSSGLEHSEAETDTKSLFETCRSKKWLDVLVLPSERSTKSEWWERYAE